MQGELHRLPESQKRFLTPLEGWVLYVPRLELPRLETYLTTWYHVHHYHYVHHVHHSWLESDVAVLALA